MSTNLIECLYLLHTREIEALGTISKGFQILIIANLLLERILPHGYSGYAILLVFRIFDLTLQGGKSYTDLKFSLKK